jgi:DNA-binding CsgD family transcriptional regulator
MPLSLGIHGASYARRTRIGQTVPVSREIQQERPIGGEYPAHRGPHLTPREREVLEHVLRGEPNKEIATQLGVAPQTVKEFVSELLRKFAVPNRAALVEAGVRLLVGDSVERSWLPQMFHGASVQIALTRGPEHRYVSANAAFMQLAGREVVGKTIREAFPELEGSGHFEVADRVYRTGETVIAHETTAIWDRGHGPEVVHTDAVLQALRSDAGVVEGLVFFGIDVTEQVRARLAKSTR